MSVSPLRFPNDQMASYVFYKVKLKSSILGWKSGQDVVFSTLSSRPLLLPLHHLIIRRIEASFDACTFKFLRSGNE